MVFMRDPIGASVGDKIYYAEKGVWGGSGGSGNGGYVDRVLERTVTKITPQRYYASERFDYNLYVEKGHRQLFGSRADAVAWLKVKLENDESNCEEKLREIRERLRILKGGAA